MNLRKGDVFTLVCLSVYYSVTLFLSNDTLLYKVSEVFFELHSKSCVYIISLIRVETQGGNPAIL